MNFPWHPAGFRIVWLLCSFVLASCSPAGSSPEPGAGYPLLGINTTPKLVWQELPRLGEIGLGSIRIPLKWEVVEPRPGQFDWAPLDRLVSMATQRKVHVLLNIRCISSWGTRHPSQKRVIYNSASAPREFAAWQRFLRELAGRYRDRAVDYEIENEVNAVAFWNGTLEEYLELLKASYPAIKAADPGAIVLPSAMACGVVRNIQSSGGEVPVALQRHNAWLAAILATGAFDAVNVHNYYFPDVTANGWTFAGYLANVRRLMAEAGMADRPVWITETGYVSRPANAEGRLDPGSAQNQAKWLELCVPQAAAAGVQRMYWLLLQDRDEPYFGSMGLLDARGQRRPAWDSMRKIAGKAPGTAQ